MVESVSTCLFTRNYYKNEKRIGFLSVVCCVFLLFYSTDKLLTNYKSVVTLVCSRSIYRENGKFYIYPLVKAVSVAF